MRQVGAEEGYSKRPLMIITPIEKVARFYPREKLFQNAIGTFLNGIGPNFLNVNQVALSGLKGASNTQQTLTTTT